MTHLAAVLVHDTIEHGALEVFKAYEHYDTYLHLNTTLIFSITYEPG